MTEEKFLKMVKDHKLEILHDEGINRHLRLKRENSLTYHFDLITWENHLCIAGDMGTYVFQRTVDMFCFFRMDKSDFNYKKDRKLQINPDYWHEKLVSDSKYESAKEFSSEAFEEYIRSSLDDYCSDEDNNIADDFKSTCWEQIEEQLLDPEDENSARESIEDAAWSDYDNEEQDDFARYLKLDFWEVDLEDYTNHFIWCLHAIVWGISQYDLQKAK